MTSIFSKTCNVIIFSMVGTVNQERIQVTIKQKNTLSNSIGKNEVQTIEVFFKKIDVSFLRNLGVSRVW